MAIEKKSKFVQAVVDRVVNDVVVAMIRHPDAAEDEPDTFKEIYILSPPILAARRKFWKAANDDKFSLEKKNPDKHVYFSKSTYWTNKCQDKELFTAFVRQIAFKGYANNIQFEAVKFGSERIPNKF